MKLTRFRHKGLERLYAQDDPKGVPAAVADKLRKLLFVLETAETLDDVKRFPGWKLHMLKGDLGGCWSLMVTANWRLIFRFNPESGNVSDIDLVDYH